MGEREREQVHEHRFVVAAPVVFEEAGFGRPAEADRRRARLGPAPVDATIELVGKAADLDFLRMRAVEVRLAEEHAREQQCGVDRRQLAVVVARAGAHVEEMVEEALVSGHAVRACALWRVPQEAQRGQHALAGVGPCDVAALDTDRIRSKAEADSRDARERWRRIAVGDEPVLRIRGVPEEAERSFFEVDQDRLDQRRERSLRRVGEAAVPVRNGRAVPQQNRDGDEHHRGDHHDPASSEHRFLHARAVVRRACPEFPRRRLACSSRPCEGLGRGSVSGNARRARENTGIDRPWVGRSAAGQRLRSSAGRSVCPNAPPGPPPQRAFLDRKCLKSGGEIGIRTLDTRKRILDFESSAFDHSAISPRAAIIARRHPRRPRRPTAPPRSAVGRIPTC